MSADLKSLLAEVNARGLRIELHDDEVHLIGPKGAADFDLRQRLRAAKPTLLPMLREAKAELDEKVALLADERDWCRDRGYLQRGEPDGLAYRQHVRRLRAAQGLLTALAEVSAHYREHVEGNLPRLAADQPVTAAPSVQARAPPPGRTFSAERFILSR